MRVGIELRQIVEGECGGIVPLIQGVLAAAFAEYSQHEFVLFCTEVNNALFPAVHPHVHILTLPRANYFSLLDVQACQLEIDVLFRSYPLDVPLAFPAGRQIVLVPDLQHEFLPQFFSDESLQQRRRSHDIALSQSGAIATLSEHARHTIRNYPGTQCSDIFLMSPALREDSLPARLADLNELERRLLPRGDFLIYPANLWPHKNHRRILQAFELLLKKNTCKSVELILTGHPGGWNGFAKEFKGLPVRHLGFVRRCFLQMLLARAKALVFFSLFEGFGMPLLEAFDAGTPVLCSNTTALPEIGGNAVLTCDPTNEHAMSNLMAMSLHDNQLRSRLIAHGKTRLSQFSWQRSARHLLDACQRLQQRRTAKVSLVTQLALIHRLNTTVLETEAKVNQLERQLNQLPLKTLRRVIGIVRRMPGIGSVRSVAGKCWQVLARATHVRIIKAARIVRNGIDRATVPRLGVFHQYRPRTLPTVASYAKMHMLPAAPVISIVTPSYNQAEFLERTLRSVLQQNYPRLEYVVQDGGSSDHTHEVLERYRHLLTHCEASPDQGQAHAINLGFRYTTGEIMAYLNSDDLLLPNALAYAARFFAAHRDVDVIYGHRVIVDENDQEVGRWILPPHDGDVLDWNDYVPQETLFWRRHVWEKIGGAMDANYQFALDWDLLLRFKEVGARFARVPRFLAAFRVHPRQKTSAQMACTGTVEIARLRIRTHGRAVSQQEIAARTRPYLRKHVIYDRLYRMGLLRY